MATNRQQIQRHIQDFNFRKLFVNELGWDHLNEPPLTIPCDGQAYVLRPLVEKRGVRVYVCDPDVQGKIPSDPILRKIEREVTKYAYEHFIIYVDATKQRQVWQWVKREQGKPLAPRLNRYYKGQSGELLAQKLEVLTIAIDEEDNDALAWINRKGESVTQSQMAILRAAECNINTSSIARPPEQHDLVRIGVEHIMEEETRNIGGQLGAPSGARRRTYERLKQYVEKTKDTLLPPSPELYSVMEEIYRYPLQETARDTLNRQLRSGIDDDQLANLVINLREDNRLCQVHEQTEPEEPQIICSLGLFEGND